MLIYILYHITKRTYIYIYIYMRENYTPETCHYVTLYSGHEYIYHKCVLAPDLAVQVPAMASNHHTHIFHISYNLI